MQLSLFRRKCSTGSPGESALIPLAFESYDPGTVADILDEEELEGLPEVQWFDPADGLRAVQSIIQHLRVHKRAFFNHEGLLQDLARVGEELSDAERAGVRFRFAIVM